MLFTQLLNSLPELTKVSTSPENVERYKENYPNLKHVKTGDAFRGYLYIDRRGNVAGVIQCNIETHYIVALEIAPKYRRRGLAKELLKTARTDLSAEYLSVRKTNIAAIKLYEHEGWVQIWSDDHMIHMAYR